MPVGGVFGELFAATLGDGIKLGFAIVVGGAPFGGDPAALLEADERGVNGALVEQDFVAGDLFDAASDAVAVEGTNGGEGLQDHKVEGALEKIELGVRHRSLLCGDHRRIARFVWECHRSLHWYIRRRRGKSLMGGREKRRSGKV